MTIILLHCDMHISYISHTYLIHILIHILIPLKFTSIIEGMGLRSCHIHCNKHLHPIAIATSSVPLGLNDVMKLPLHRRIDGNCYTGKCDYCCCRS